MSKVVIAGDASGTGTFTISAPNGNTDRTLVLPDEAGTVALTSQLYTQGPAFAAYMSAPQGYTSGVWTKMVFDTEHFDTDSCYDTSVYRFTPTKAGIYQVTANGTSSSGTGNYFYITLHKNGTRYGGLSGMYIASTNLNDDMYESYTCLMSLNGTTDYVEAYGIGNISGATFGGFANETLFSAVWIRSN